LHQQGFVRREERVIGADGCRNRPAVLWAAEDEPEVNHVPGLQVSLDAALAKMASLIRPNETGHPASRQT
jgi:hypothetical protein